MDILSTSPSGLWGFTNSISYTPIATRILVSISTETNFRYCRRLVVLHQFCPCVDPIINHALGARNDKLQAQVSSLLLNSAWADKTQFTSSLCSIYNPPFRADKLRNNISRCESNLIQLIKKKDFQKRSRSALIYFDL